MFYPPPIEKIDVSIIIPVYNQFKYTMQCLNSIKQNTQDVNYEIIIIDDCSTDETKNLEQFAKNVKIIRNESNLGFLRNCNKAAKEAKGKYLYLLNNDTIVLKNAILELKNILDKYDNCAAAGSKLVYPNGKLQGAGSIIFEAGNVYSIGHLNNPMFYEYNILKEVDYCCGASLMIKKFLWDKSGGFDEIYAPGYYEETDLCLRFKMMGFKIIYQSKSEVIHFTSKSFTKKTKNLMQINKSKFQTKWNEYLKTKKVQ